MLRVLLKARLQSLMNTMFGRYSRRVGGRGLRFGMNKLGISALAIFIVAALGFSFGSMFYLIAEPLAAAGLGHLYFAVAAIMAISFCFIGSIFITQSQIFTSNDNDLLLSMPIKPRYILVSRILTLLALNYVYTLALMVPAIVAYSLANGASAAVIIPAAVGTLFMPLISMTITCVLGWLIAFISSRVPKNNLLTNVMFMGAFIAYFAFAMQLQKYMQRLLENGAAIAVVIKRSLPPIYYFGNAVAEGSIIDLLWFALTCIIPFAIVYMLLSKFFISIVTTNKGNVRVKYKERAMKASGRTTALIRKEASRLFGTPMYLLNCGFGAVLHLALAVVIVVKGDSFVGALLNLPEVDMSGIMPGMICLCIAFCSMMSPTTAPSISLEGKGLWILKSAPVSTRKVLGAKLAFNLLCAGPTGLIASIAAVVIVPMSALESAAVIILPFLALLFSALLGLVCNLLFPRFDWVSEAAVVKQSMSVMITVLCGMGIVMGAAVAYIFLHDKLSVISYLLICMGVLAAASAALFAFLRTKGEKLYEAF